MPLYDLVCDNGHKFERMIPLVKFEEAQHCACSAPARRIISRPMIAVESVDYTCPITGEYISSKRAHQNNLAKHGCRVLETGEREYNEQRRLEADRALDKKIEDFVEKEISTYSGDKIEALGKELAHSDISIDRTCPDAA